MIRGSGAGSQSAAAAGPAPAGSGPSRAVSSPSVGRSAGSFSRQPPTACRNSSGSEPSSGASWTVRKTTAAACPPPNGPVPVAAYASTQPRENTSPAGPATGPPARASSGARYPGVPTTASAAVSVVAPAARAIPKSIRRGPSGASRTLPGLTSRWISPAVCTSVRASARRAPRIRTVRTGSGPYPPTASASEGPGTNGVASHGSRASGSAAITGTTQRPVSPPAACASRRNRARKAGSAAWSARITLTATRTPSGERPR